MEIRIAGAVRCALLAGFLLAGCSYGPDTDRRTDFVLFFSSQQTSPDAAAAAIIEQAAAAARAMPDAEVTVAGYADPARTPQSNQILSRIRAQLVADALVQHGVPRLRVRLEPRRAIGGDPGIESRRVEIRILP